MQKIEETHDRLFQELKKTLQEFSGYQSKEDFIQNIEKIKTFYHHALELKIYQKIIDASQHSQDNETERKAINFEINIKPLQDIGLQATTPLLYSSESIEDEKYFEQKEQEQIALQEQIEKEIFQEFSEKSIAKAAIEKQNEEERAGEDRRKIIEIEKSNNESPKTSNPTEKKHQEERKFKLANIKGLKTTVKSLFDDDPLENIEAESQEEKNTEEISTEKNKVTTEYLEVKPYQGFKLDINDRLAFTKMLFNGSQVELNQLINHLNGFTTLEEAKSYLSEQYYERNWQEAEEYAQRLWTLVESKFL